MLNLYNPCTTNTYRIDKSIAMALNDILDDNKLFSVFYHYKFIFCLFMKRKINDTITCVEHIVDKRPYPNRRRRMQTQSEEDAATFRETMNEMSASFRVIAEAQMKSAEAHIGLASAVEQLVQIKLQKLKLLERTTHSSVL